MDKNAAMEGGLTMDDENKDIDLEEETVGTEASDLATAGVEAEESMEAAKTEAEEKAEVSETEVQEKAEASAAEAEEKAAADLERRRRAHKLSLRVLLVFTVIVAAYIIYALVTQDLNIHIFQILLGLFLVAYVVLMDVVEPKLGGLFEDIDQERKSAYYKMLVADIIGSGALLYWVIGIGTESGADILIPAIIYLIAMQGKRKFRDVFEGYVKNEPADEEAEEEEEAADEVSEETTKELPGSDGGDDDGSDGGDDVRLTGGDDGGQGCGTADGEEE